MLGEEFMGKSKVISWQWSKSYSEANLSYLRSSIFQWFTSQKGKSRFQTTFSSTIMCMLSTELNKSILEASKSYPSSGKDKRIDSFMDFIPLRSPRALLPTGIAKTPWKYAANPSPEFKEFPPWKIYQITFVRKLVIAKRSALKALCACYSWNRQYRKVSVGFNLSTRVSPVNNKSDSTFLCLYPTRTAKQSPGSTLQFGASGLKILSSWKNTFLAQLQTNTIW